MSYPLPFFSSPLDASLFVVVFWSAVGGLSLFFSRVRLFPLRWMFLPGALGGALLAFSGYRGLDFGLESRTLPLGLPDLPFHVREDGLSAFFLLLLGAVSFGVSVFSAGYFKGQDRFSLGRLLLEFHLFQASMTCVLLAGDAYFFLLAWESMALTSYFLVVTDHGDESVRRAGFLYLLLAHIGTLALFLAFGILAGGSHVSGFDQYTFDRMRSGHLSTFAQACAFFLAFLGFGAKAGILPLHVWLPDAHPAAPSPVSALMSGVMLKTAIYGMVRVWFDLIGLHGIAWEWGAAVLLVGMITSLFGVLYALMQHDLKRLLAYHSIENIGIIVIGLGLSLVFFGTGHPVPGVLGLVAALYHTLNHAIFKGLLFLGAGSILHATGERDLNRMGGLMRVMPQTAVLFLTGALAISAIPPLNGFVSEWLTFQTALSVSTLDIGVLRSLIALSAAVLALAGALTAMCFVKVFGIGFLGVRRTAPDKPTHEATLPERMGMLWLGIGCLVLGVLPVAVLNRLGDVSLALTGQGLPAESKASGWLWLVPESARKASYSPFIFFVVVLGSIALTFLAIRLLFNSRIRRAPSWNCGYPVRNPRMQDTADAFSQPIRHFFAPVYLMKRQLPSPEDEKPHFHVTIGDRHWNALYLPVLKIVGFLSALAGKLQTGRISVYLLYSFLTLLFLLFLVKAS